MSIYVRSVLFRFAGALASSALWLGLIVLALANFDTIVSPPEQLSATWPFWLVAVVVAVGVFFIRRRLSPGPGWGAFTLGAIAPFLGLMLNANVGDSGGLWFWLPVLALVFVPLPGVGGRETAEDA